MGLVGDAEAEGASQEGRAASGGKEEDNIVAQSYHGTVFTAKIWQAIRQATDGDGGGVSPPRQPMHENWATGCGGPTGEAPGHACPPVENPTCTAFEKYEEVPETVPLDFTEDGVT